MKYLPNPLLFLIIFILPLACFSQKLKTDNVDYSAYVVSEYSASSVKGDVSDAHFAFRSDTIKTNLSGQKRVFYLTSSWKETILDTGNTVEIAEAKDSGGFRLTITLGFDEPLERYFIILAYNNVTFFYEVRKE